MKEIKAKEGYYLTQVGDVEDRLFLTAIKGVNVNEYDLREATVSEKEEWEKSHEVSKPNYPRRK